jgi:hypothetical protein
MTEQGSEEIMLTERERGGRERESRMSQEKVRSKVLHKS